MEPHFHSQSEISGTAQNSWKQGQQSTSALDQNFVPSNRFLESSLNFQGRRRMPGEKAIDSPTNKQDVLN
jgi:hypothetical protein